jgi:iron complex outermembrane receptor protein
MCFGLRASLFVAVSLSALVIGSPSFAEGSAAASGSGGGVQAVSYQEIETVVVTARRREENQQNVPVAITAFSGSDLEARGVQRPQDLTAAVPSMNVFGQNRDDAEITMRGQSPGTINPGQRPVAGVQTYFAEVPTLASGPGIFYDLQSVQVFKGPQGTLFGRNTTGGAVMYQPAAPVGEFEAYAKVSVGDYGMNEYEGMVNVPIDDDQLMLRVAGDINRRDGFTQSVITGERQDSVGYNAFRISLLWKPSERFSNSLIVDGRDTNDTGTSEILNQVNPNALITPILPLYLGGAKPNVNCLLNTSYNGCVATYGAPASYYTNLFAAAAAAGGYALYPNPMLQDALSAQQALGPRKDEIPILTGYKELARGLTNTTIWNIDDNLLVKNIFGYRLVNSNQTTDFGGSYLNFVNIVNGLTSEEQLTDELQFQGSSGGGFNWIAGAYYEEGKPSRTQRIPNVAFGFTATEFPDFYDTSLAGFVHAEQDLSSWLSGLKVSGGLRFTEDKRKLSEYITGANALPLTSEKGKYGALTWDATVEYRANDNVMGYITGRRGYKTGGFNLPAPTPALQTFGPEHLYDLEAGLKTDWDLDGTPLRVNVDAFHDWYGNAQLELPAVTGGTLETVTSNVGSAAISGVELEGVVIPVPDLQLSAFGSIDDTQYSAQSCKLYNACGRIPFVPEYKYGASATWQLPLSADIGQVSLEADYSWVDFVWTSDKAAPLHTYPSYGLLNLRADWKMFDWGVTASAFVTNATDDTYIQGGYPLYSGVGFDSVIYGAPRMYGFSLAYKFGD